MSSSALALTMTRNTWTTVSLIRGVCGFSKFAQNGVISRYFNNTDFHCMQTKSHTFGFQTAPPDQNHPRIVSRLVTLESSSRICHQVLPNLFFTMT